MTDRDRVASELGEAGLAPGSAVLVHSSLSSLGRVQGGAETVIGGLLDALGPEGTLLMPALSYAAVTETSPRFDLRSTPSNVGTIPETFRRMPGVLRSLHPTHSVCGAGPRARELLAPHAGDRTPCGPGSPFRLLARSGGSILMLGCGLRPNTSMHGVEELVEPPYLFGGELSITLVREDGSEVAGSYRMHGFSGHAQRYDRVATLGEGPWLRQARVLEATVHLIDAAELWRRAEEALRRDPLFFVERVSGNPAA
jgi:aminoglycoside 3-N-acetyltransferase